MIRGIFVLLALVRWYFLPDRSRIDGFTVRSLRFSALEEAVVKGTITRRKAIALVMHSWLFPFFLTLYLIVLLVDQTHVFNLHLSNRFFLLEKTWLLSMTIVTGLITALVDEQHTEKRISIVPSPRAGRGFVILCGALGMVGTYIIRTQTLELGWISFLIAAIAGVLLILVGFLLLEEEVSEE